MALPIVALGIVGIVLGSRGSSTPAGGASSASGASPQPAITAPAPVHARQFNAQCTKVLQHLPVRLQKLAPRVVHTVPDTPYVVAWGNPPVVLRCGVARPPALHPGSSADFLSATGQGGPFFDVTHVSTATGQAEVWTTVDRAAYVSITVPVRYSSQPLPPLARAIAAALPPVCSVGSSAPAAQRCTHRP